MVAWARALTRLCRVAPALGAALAALVATPGAGAAAAAPVGINSTVYASLRASVQNAFSLSPSYGLLCAACDAGHTLGAIVRLAFHDAAGVNRPNGCIDYSTADNSNLADTQAKLDSARLGNPFGLLVSKADFYVLAATLVIELASTMAASPDQALFDTTSNPLDPQVQPLVLPFVSGRVDDASCVGDHEILPATNFSWSKIAALFQGRFGFSSGEVVAIMGAHSLGRVNNAPGVTGNVSKVSWVLSSTSFSTNYYSVLLRAKRGWFQTRNLNGTIDANGGSPNNVVNGASSDAWALAASSTARVGGADVKLIMLRTDVELGVNTTSTFIPSAGPSVDNTCGAFALEMQPAILPGQTQLSAQQSASCPRRESNLAAMSDFLTDYRLWYGNFSGAWAKLTRYGYSATELCAVDACVTTAAPSATGAPSSPTPASQPASPTKAPSTATPSTATPSTATPSTATPSTIPPSSVTPTKQPASSQAPSSAPTWLPSSPSQTPTTSRPTAPSKTSSGGDRQVRAFAACVTLLLTRFAHAR